MSGRRLARAGGSAKRRVRAVLLALGAAACGVAAPADRAQHPSLVLPARLPERSKEHEPVAAPPTPATPFGALSSPEPASRTHGDLPDPEPLSERAQWVYTIAYDRGEVRVGEPELICLPRPAPTARRIGRHAFELWLGRELIDRVRFDFPLLAAEEPPAQRRPLRDSPRFAPGARVSTRVRVPASERATSARILDRATGESFEVSWPPPAPPGTSRPRECPAAPPAAGAAHPPRSGRAPAAQSTPAPPLPRDGAGM